MDHARQVGTLPRIVGAGPHAAADRWCRADEVGEFLAVDNHLDRLPAGAIVEPDRLGRTRQILDESCDFSLEDRRSRKPETVKI